MITILIQLIEIAIIDTIGVGIIGLIFYILFHKRKKNNKKELHYTQLKTLDKNSSMNKNESQFSVSRYLDRIEKLHTEILLQREKQEKPALELWWGLDGIALLSDGTIKTLSKREIENKEIQRQNYPIKEIQNQKLSPIIELLRNTTTYKIEKNLNGTYQLTFYIPHTQIKCSCQVLPSCINNLSFNDLPFSVSVINEKGKTTGLIYKYVIEYVFKNQECLYRKYIKENGRSLTLPEFNYIYAVHNIYPKYNFEMNSIDYSNMWQQQITFQNQIQTLQQENTISLLKTLQMQQNSIIIQNIRHNYLSCC